MSNAEVAAAGDIVVLTVPAEHQLATISSVKAQLRNKILIDFTVPLVLDLPTTARSSETGYDGYGQ